VTKPLAEFNSVFDIS